MIYIIILNYNGFTCTDFCLESLRKVTFKDIKIILVDNDSSDGSFELLMNKYPECVGIKNSENGGFSRGTNIGMQYAYNEGAEYIMLLNNDVEVTAGFIEPMMEEFTNNEDVGLVTPKIMFRNPNNIIWQAGGSINVKIVSAISYGYREVDAGQYDQICETGWASGACSIIKRSTVEKIGFLDEFYFFGQEEWDYSVSALKQKIKIIYAPKSIVYHEIGASTNVRPSLSVYQNYRNKLYFGKKHKSVFNYLAWIIIFFAYVLFLFPRPSHVLGKSDYFKRAAKMAGILAFKYHFLNIWVDKNHLDLIESRLKKRYDK